jgi:hypothetical protein
MVLAQVNGPGDFPQAGAATEILFQETDRLFDTTIIFFC